ncbi:hypothetical protein FNV43_RR26865 [Rhamnella rubrinervis]|uniref:Uncharacterized protein n=1 Tax=Rhamnella rubrinervis TaxID=2594499 RepID=A0A8K0DKJ5_9ROSA|nr:hypothetical protein FNV43_RR26865 [Rhamnella rubrinervis]
MCYSPTCQRRKKCLRFAEAGGLGQGSRRAEREADRVHVRRAGIVYGQLEGDHAFGMEDQTGGLQVKYGGVWVGVEPSHGANVINVRD